MEIVNSGSTYQIYDESLITYRLLPSQNYIVRFDKRSGFFLEKYEKIEIKEKIYGVHEEKINKVLKSFEKFDRHLGVILSGHKGIGKSLFAKMLSIRAVESNIPLIIVDTYIPGIASFLESIQQEVMILFDEFDKTYGSVKAEDGMADPQVELLTLFDGVGQGKKMFVITCNNIRNLNEYLINRPGRFHYHFRFDFPSPEEIKEYLEDKLEEQYYGEIAQVIAFSKKIDLNYDCLRSIAFEINTGISFAEAIKDLNIININEEFYNLTLQFENGETLKLVRSNSCSLDLFNSCTENRWFGNGNNYVACVSFDTADVVFDINRGVPYIPAKDLQVEFSTDPDTTEETTLINHFKELKVECLWIVKKKDKSYHYTV